MSKKTVSFTLGATLRHTPTEQVGIVEQILPAVGGRTKPIAKTIAAVTEVIVFDASQLGWH
jgi:hypothetical protein